MIWLNVCQIRRFLSFLYLEYTKQANFHWVSGACFELPSCWVDIKATFIENGQLCFVAESESLNRDLEVRMALLINALSQRFCEFRKWKFFVLWCSDYPLLTDFCVMWCELRNDVLSLTSWSNYVVIEKSFLPHKVRVNLCFKKNLKHVYVFKEDYKQRRHKALLLSYFYKEDFTEREIIAEIRLTALNISCFQLPCFPLFSF